MSPRGWSLAILSALGALALLATTGLVRAEAASAPSGCASAARCAAAGRLALKSAEAASAIRLFKLEAQYAEDARDAKASGRAYENIATAYLGQREYRRALAWNHLALRIAPQSAAARHIRAQIEAHIDNARRQAPIGGTYVQYAGRAYWSSLCVSRGSADELRLRLMVYRIGAAWRKYGPAGYGDLSGAALLAGDRARYTGTRDFPSCRIELTFSPDGASLEQGGDCGFGYGVRAAGHFERLDTADGPDCDQHHLP